MLGWIYFRSLYLGISTDSQGVLHHSLLWTLPLTLSLRTTGVKGTTVYLWMQTRNLGAALGHLFLSSSTQGSVHETSCILQNFSTSSKTPFISKGVSCGLIYQPNLRTVRPVFSAKITHFNNSTTYPPLDFVHCGFCRNLARGHCNQRDDTADQGPSSPGLTPGALDGW